MKAMETIQDLIEEAKLRTLWWVLCVFAISYFLSRKRSFCNREFSCWFGGSMIGFLFCFFVFCVGLIQ